MSSETNKAECQLQFNRVNNVDKAQLYSEIDFWKGLIACFDDDKAPEILERMHQAQALAEHRLAAHSLSRSPASTAPGKRPSNVYPIKDTKRQ